MHFIGIKLNFTSVKRIRIIAVPARHPYSKYKGENINEAITKI
jgi:hypothetical protein